MSFPFNTRRRIGLWLIAALAFHIGYIIFLTAFPGASWIVVYFALGLLVTVVWFALIALSALVRPNWFFDEMSAIRYEINNL